MNGQIILNSSIVLAAFLIIIGILYSMLNSKQLAQHRKQLAELHQNLKVGSEVMFSGGLTGFVTELDTEFVKIRLAEKLVMKVSRYAITEIL